jgi:AdoMet-dependent heme synthase
MSLQMIFGNLVKNVSIEINNTCFFKCRMCYFWKNELIKNDKNALNINQYKEFIQDLAKICGPDTVVSITGGEPLMSKNTIKVLNILGKNRFKTLLNTNGWLLSNEIINQLQKSDLTKIGISLDGSTAQIHDTIRGKPGSYKRIMIAINNLKTIYCKNKKNIEININTTISKLNLNDIENIIDLVDSNKNIDRIKFQAITSPFGIDFSKLPKNKYWFELNEYSDLWPTNKNNLNKVYDMIKKKLLKSQKINASKKRLKLQFDYFQNPKNNISGLVCGVSNDLKIAPNGDVFLCSHRNFKLGNIKNNKISEIWSSLKYTDFQKKINSCNKNCHELINTGFPKI